MPDLALSITRSLDNSEFTVLLILIILFTTIFFCHGLIRLCMLVTRPQRYDDRSTDVPGGMSFAGFSLPRRPIRVLLARDEEAAGVESETTKLQPPAYGVWRESVVSRARDPRPHPSSGSTTTSTYGEGLHD